MMLHTRGGESEKLGGSTYNSEELFALRGAWAPDGSRIAYVDKSAEQGSFGPASLSWSPDSQWFAYVVGDGSVDQVRVASVARPSAPAVLAESHEHHPELRWVRQGHRLLMAIRTAPEDLGASLYLAGPDGEPPVLLSGEWEVQRWWAQSPSGAHVAFEARRIDGGVVVPRDEILLSSLKGGPPVFLTEAYTLDLISVVRWAGDDRVAISSGSRREAIFSVGLDGVDPTWIPASRQGLWWASMSPDGSGVLYAFEDEPEAFYLSAGDGSDPMLLPSVRTDETKVLWLR